MRSLLLTATILALAGTATASSGPARAIGPHDVGETALASYWLPRHGFAAAGSRFMALWTATYAPSALRPGPQSDICLARSR